MWFNNDRLSHWLVGAVFSWTLAFFILGLPIFHLWLKLSTSQVAVFVALCCAVQLATTPWLFSARATSLNPKGSIARRGVALVVEFSAASLLFFYFVLRNQIHNPDTRQFVLIGVGLTILFAGASLIWLLQSSKRRNDSIPLTGPRTELDEHA